MTQISATVVAHSINEQGDELVTMLLVHPRIILAELNTHRMFSRNSASSRAIPFKKMVKSVQENPFIPIAWQKDHKGMQGNNYLEDKLSIQFATIAWLTARDMAIIFASSLHATDNGYESVTKQLCNRLLEPFMWHTTLVTTGKEGLENFFNLRCPQYGGETFLGVEKYFKSKKEALKHLQSVGVNISNLVRSTDLEWQQVNKGQAEIHIMALAEAMYDTYHESKPEFLKKDEWHIPFKDKISPEKIIDYIKATDRDTLALWYEETIIKRESIKISTAMCARTSYTKVGDEIDVDYAKLVELHDKLILQDPLHASPMEHIARCMNESEYEVFAKRTLKNFGQDVESGWCYNFRGFIPYRYFLDNKIDHYEQCRSS